jgi:para-aminobenzoate synthetase/4-amino-4-deoxychorismate lyase
MQIIEELESTPRGLYTGCAGYITPDGRAQFNVAIRTVVIDKGKNRAIYGVGGGIVWDSEERSEREECRIKTGILSRRTPDFSLLESVLWCPDEGFFLLDGHMDRLRSSAAYFNFACDEKLILDTLHSFVQSLPCSSPHKVRLILEKDGCLTVESMPLSLEKGKKIMVCLAKDPVNCDDVFLFHKTTNRNVYDNSRASCPGYDDVILWNSNREITESCSANVVVDLDGELCTPPVNCGLLDGVYRAQLIRDGRVKERALTIDDLTLCTHVYLINSVRKTREAFLS